MTLDEIVGGSPYGATTIAGGQGQRQLSQNELQAARFQGRLVANTAAKQSVDITELSLRCLRDGHWCITGARQSSNGEWAEYSLPFSRICLGKTDVL
jgi:hypothetical protein